MKIKNKYLGGKIYDWRKQNEVSQEDFADMVGVTRQTVLKWEAGTVIPKSEKLQQISEIIGIGLEQLISEPNKEPAVEVVATEAPIESQDVKSTNKKVKLSKKAKIIIVAAVLLVVLLIGVFLIIYDNILSAPHKGKGIETVESDVWNVSIENIGWIAFGVSIAVGVILGAILICKALKSKKNKINNETNDIKS